MFIFYTRNMYDVGNKYKKKKITKKQLKKKKINQYFLLPTWDYNPTMDLVHVFVE